MANQFELGDVVRLKSTGPDMTIEKIDGDQISCVWFEGNTRKREIFAAYLLEKKPEPRTIPKDFGRSPF